VEVLLGVTGCIGAYKVPELVRLLRAGGAGVTVVLTRAAEWFVTPGTLQTVSERPVYTQMFAPHQAEGIEHIDLARRADLLLVAPATANIIGKFAHGIADDFLTTLHLACRCPVVLAPAMNTAMYEHPAVSANLETLRRRGVRLLGPGSGDLACGETGPGRLLEPAEIAAAVLAPDPQTPAWQGLRVLVTSGPTREPLDAVRFISNPSSGRMGHALAAAAARRGAQVTLVSGPTHLGDPAGVQVVQVQSVEEMRQAVLAHADACDLVLMAAAVGDLRVAQPVSGKMKKTADGMVLKLESAPDILAELGRRRGSGTHPILVGFAAETDDLERHALAKMKAKNLDHIVANPVGRNDAGFAADTNQVTLLSRSGDVDPWPLMSKAQVAERLLDHLREKHFADRPAVPRT
jgi:phosphopantothenoylcysteine decarboxylase/phosphopantothenate--cysteine ligase